MKPEKLVNIAAFIVLLVAAYFTLFNYLGASPLHIWDEARLANNAIEMMDKGNFMVTHFWGRPDMWCTKPPLMVWFQVMSMKFLGYNELAVRLPSAIAAFFTCIVMILFSKSVLGSYRPGYLASLVLLTIGAYVGFHVARNGDHDSILILFATSAVLSAYAYMVKLKVKYLYLMGISLTLAILAKGVAGLFFTPMMAIWLLALVGAKQLLTNKHFYFSMLIIVVFGLGYYAIREVLNPGFLEAVYKNELGGRMGRAIDGHAGDFWQYFNAIINHSFVRWVNYLLLAMVVLVVFRNRLPENAKWLGLYLFTCCVFMLLVISVAATKNPWYDAPVFPLLALIIGTFIHYVLKAFPGKAYDSKVALAAITVVVIFYNPIKVMAKDLMNVDKYQRVENRFGPYLKRISDMKPELKKIHITPEGYNAPVKFFVYVYNNQKGYNLSITHIGEHHIGDTLIECEPNVRAILEEKYNFEVLDGYGGCSLMVIKSDKQDSTTANY